MIKKFIIDQKAKFGIFNKAAKTLIWSNLFFGVFNPFFLIFSNTFIFSTTRGNLEFNILYSIFTFAGIVLGFLINGYLIRLFHIKKLMAVGEFMFFMAIAALFIMPDRYLTGSFIYLFGVISGVGNGFYWSSRNFLTFTNTSDDNRDFFAGLDFILISGGRIVTPLLIGIYIGEGVKHGWFSHQFAYKSSLIFGFCFVFISSLLIIKEKYGSAKTEKFIFYKYNKLWNQARFMVFVLGLFQGAIFVIPPVLIMKYIGSESVVGTLSSLSYLVAIVLVYRISSRSGVEHRTGIIKLGIAFLITGIAAFILTIQTNVVLAVSILAFFMFMSEPVMSFPVRATVMKAIENMKFIENREAYAYLFDIELYTGISRVTSIFIFYFLFTSIRIYYALSVYLAVIAILQLLILIFSKRINGK
jgi:MFS transporter, YQGE family, putative transporter